MSLFDPELNRIRILEDLGSLSRRDAMGELITRTIEHSAKRDLIVVFDAEPDRFEVGRIVLFQDFIYIHTGISPVVAAQQAHCIKVFFDLGEGWREQRADLLELFNSEDFDELREGLDIFYIQFAGQIIPPQRINR
jgi:hypothetical protein